MTPQPWHLSHQTVHSLQVFGILFGLTVFVAAAIVIMVWRTPELYCWRNSDQPKAEDCKRCRGYGTLIEGRPVPEHMRFAYDGRFNSVNANERECGDCRGMGFVWRYRGKIVRGIIGDRDTTEQLRRLRILRARHRYAVLQARRRRRLEILRAERRSKRGGRRSGS